MSTTEIIVPMEKGTGDITLTVKSKAITVSMERHTASITVDMARNSEGVTSLSYFDDSWFDNWFDLEKTVELNITLKMQGDKYW